MLRKIFLVLSLLFYLSGLAYAQGVEITPLYSAGQTQTSSQNNAGMPEGPFSQSQTSQQSQSGVSSEPSVSQFQQQNQGSQTNPFAQSQQTAPQSQYSNPSVSQSQQQTLPEQNKLNQAQQEMQSSLLNGKTSTTITNPALTPLSKPSAFEEFISGSLPSSVSVKNLKQFGYNLFISPPSTFAPLMSVPVGPNYIIGPNDQIKIDVWGSINDNLTLTVNRDGNINIPGVGVVSVAGLKFSELKGVIQNAFSKYYKNFNLNITMGSLRTMTIYVVGYAAHPGSYTVSSLSTLINALFACGGPSKIGSMRNIEVKRDGKTITHFDMYDFLIYGDTTGNIRLQPGDIIYIPPIGPEVAIAGAVKNPAIYELKGRTSILALIEMAGGLQSFAFTGRVQVYRIVDHQVRMVFEDSLKDLRNLETLKKHPEANFIVHGGDLVKIFSVPEELNTVKLEGAVAMPGSFAIKPNVTTLKTVIDRAGGLLYYASDKAEITRTSITQEGPKVERFYVNLAKALKDDPKDNIKLERGDYIFVRTIPNWHPYEYVYIGGQVKYPGVYPITPGERLSSVLERAGGYAKDAYLRGAVFTRASVQKIQQQSIDLMINRLQQQLLASNAQTASTAVSSTTTEAAQVTLANAQALIASLRSVKASGRVTINLAPIRILKGSSEDIPLENGDSLYIPVRNDVVNVVGAVMSPGSYVYNPHYTWKDYIEMAGGYESYADTKDVYVYRANGSAVKVSHGLVSWNPYKDRWEFAAFAKEDNRLWPGDTIIVPQKIQEFPWLRNIKDITQILMNIAVTAGVAIHLY
ncbi:MAG: SLBB domain-containing protein [Desulfurella sp.]|uniref:SLBB domain-containing protein n=1 Tax=Desulfurella sp. TaxID=1962857 RepID=UPI003D11BCF3